jgi:hypothetical protein
MKTNKIFFIIILAAIVIPFASVSATTWQLKDIISNVSTALTDAAVGLSTIAFVVAGIMYLTATGNPSRIQLAKGSLIAGIIGIVIIALASISQSFVCQIFFHGGCPVK